jgi:hypothetical protein
MSLVLLSLFAHHKTHTWWWVTWLDVWSAYFKFDRHILPWKGILFQYL